MGLVDQDEFVAGGVELVQAVARCDALYGGDCNVGGPGGLVAAHFNVHMLGGVCKSAVARSLLDELTAMSEDERLGSIATGRNAIDEVGEDDGFARTRCQRHAQALVAGIQIRQDGLNAFLLVLTQHDGARWWRGQRRG